MILENGTGRTRRGKRTLGGSRWISGSLLGRKKNAGSYFFLEGFDFIEAFLINLTLMHTLASGIMIYPAICQLILPAPKWAASYCYAMSLGINGRNRYPASDSHVYSVRKSVWKSRGASPSNNVSGQAQIHAPKNLFPNDFFLIENSPYYQPNSKLPPILAHYCAQTHLYLEWWPPTRGVAPVKVIWKPSWPSE